MINAKKNYTYKLYIIFKLKKKIKEKILKKATEARIIIKFNFSEAMRAREWNEIFRVFREIKSQPRNLYPVQLSFMNEGDIKTFSDNNLGMCCH